MNQLDKWITLNELLLCTLFHLVQILNIRMLPLPNPIMCLNSMLPHGVVCMLCRITTSVNTLVDLTS